MRFAGFIGPSYTLSSVNVDCQRCINLYPEVSESGAGKEKEAYSLPATPGLSTLVTLPQGPVRAVYASSNGRVFAIGGNKLYELSSLWVATERGTLGTSSGPVSVSDSGRYLAIVDGSTSGYYLKFSNNTVSSIPFPTQINFNTFAGCDQVVYQDGYFIFNHKGSGDFFISGLVTSIVADETTIDPLDFKNSEGLADPVKGIISDHRDLWMFNSQSIEIYFNSGAVDFPFERNQGAFIEHGLAATFSVAKMNNTVFWLGQDDKGAGQVFMATGYQPQRISNHAIEQSIQKYSTLSDARAYTYQENGHSFYVLNFPSANTTWVFDAATNLWHERVYTNQGQFERHRGDCHAFAFGKHIVGDYANGKVYELSSAIYSDAGTAITRRRVSPHATAGLMNVFYKRFQLDIESGTGLDGITQGTDPQVMLRFSDDGGHTWSNEKWTSFGKMGQTKKRAFWNRLGRSRDRVFEITITDPVKVRLIGAELDVEAGAN